ncbi:MAG: insulinase family protein [Chlorobi bacterium]|nr:insulinase family protein [Chlorobiota bacterium]
MKQKMSLFLMLFVFAGLLFAQGRKIEFTEYDLDNGLHVILHQDHSVPIVGVTVFYHVGSKNEKPDRTGFAHFFEHLMFEGSDNIPRGEYFKIVQSNGGELNATTDFDRTYYYEILPSNQLKLGLWLESERMLHLKVDSIGVETQRKVVKEERKQRLDNQPYGSFLEQTMKHAYKVHPYRWTPIGSAQYIDQATLGEFMDFYKTYYVPNNATLTVVGDFKINEAKEWIDEYFGSIPKGTKKMNRPTIVEPKQTAEVKDTVYDNIQLPLVLFAYHVPEKGGKDYYPLQMLNTLLSSGKSSRMNKNIVDKKQLALNSGSFNFSLEDPGLFVMYSIANAGVSADSLQGAMDEEVGKVKNEEISEHEFEKLQNQVESDFVSSNASIAGIAASLANYYNYFHDTNLINTELEKYMEVTREDIQRVAKEYLTPENRVVLYYLPKSEEKK